LATLLCEVKLSLYNAAKTSNEAITKQRAASLFNNHNNFLLKAERVKTNIIAIQWNSQTA